jgi:hypothetical protein
VYGAAHTSPCGAELVRGGGQLLSRPLSSRARHVWPNPLLSPSLLCFPGQRCRTSFQPVGSSGSIRCAIISPIKPPCSLALAHPELGARLWHLGFLFLRHCFKVGLRLGQRQLPIRPPRSLVAAPLDSSRFLPCLACFIQATTTAPALLTRSCRRRALPHPAGRAWPAIPVIHRLQRALWPSPG